MKLLSVILFAAAIAALSFGSGHLIFLYGEQPEPETPSGKFWLPNTPTSPRDYYRNIRYVDEDGQQWRCSQWELEE